MKKLAFDYIVGTGGIGKGILFQLTGNHPLGRNESRLAELTDFRDYCKLHIILHYAAYFTQGKIPVYALGCVGRDTAGGELLRELKREGIDTRYIRQDEESKTLYAVCYQYPTGEGGNITTSNSACSKVLPENIDLFFEEEKPAGRGLFLAAPEVPLESRLCLLRWGRRKNGYNVAALLSGEAAEFAAQGGFGLVDLLALNSDEAAAIAALEPETRGESEPEARCIRFLRRQNSRMSVVITRGGAGAHTYWGNSESFSPVVQNAVVNTAGAGDCFLGTVIAALAHGIPLGKSEPPPVLSSAADLGGVSSSMKIGCSDTIHFGINKESLWAFSRENGVLFSQQIKTDFFQRE